MLRVCFNCYGSYTTDSIYQWDQNHTLTISGLDIETISAVHFCNKKRDEAIVVNVTRNNDSVTAPIPNELLQEPYNVIAYVHTVDDNNAKTIEIITIPLIKRVRPSEYQFTDNVEIKNFEKLEKDIVDFIELTNFKYDNFTKGVNDVLDDIQRELITIDGRYPTSDERYTIIKPRRGTAKLWSMGNPVLAEYEIGIELPEGEGQIKIKLGDGVTHWNDLPYCLDDTLSVVTVSQILNNSEAGGIKIIEINGDSIQDGTPTLTDPKEFNYVAESGSLTITSSGKNLVNIPNGTYEESLSVSCNLKAGKYIYSFDEFNSSKSAPYGLRIDGGMYGMSEIAFNIFVNEVEIETDFDIVGITIFAGENESKSVGHNFTITNAMVRPYGSSKTYVPVQGTNSITIPLSQPLRKGDKITKQGGAWGVLRSTKVVPFGGTWQYRSTFPGSDGSYCYSSADFITDNYKSLDDMYMACNKLIFGGGVTAGTNISDIGKKGYFYKIAVKTSTSGTTTYVCSDAQTVDDFLAEMEGTVFEYTLANPVFEPFSIDVQLALNSLKGYDVGTYVTTDSEVAPSILVEYGTNRTGVLAIENNNLISNNEILIAEVDNKLSNYYDKSQIDALFKVINDALPYAINIDEVNKTIDFTDR